MIVSNVAIRNATSVFVLMLLVVAAGSVSYLTLPREGAPDVATPWVLVTTAYEGVSPADIESSVTMKIEKELAGVKGLKEMTSTSAEGSSIILLEFLPEVRVEEALQHVRDKIDLAKGELPGAAEEPVIKEISVADFPIMIVNLTGDVEPFRLKLIADGLEDAIEAIPGVLNVDVLGGREREIRLEIDPDRVAAYGLSIPELLELIPSENVNISAGALETPGVRFNIRVPAEFAEAQDVDRLALATRNGKTIYLTDVAEVRDTFKDRESYARLDGADSITLSVQKRTGEDITRIAAIVRYVLSEAAKTLPAGMQYEITLDQSKDIGMMVRDLENSVVSGLILVVAVLVLFLGWRTSMIVALAIPMSMLISFSVLSALDYTLNMIVLFSLILALGMLVDNAIVIVENIFRHRQLGYGRMEAAMKGTGEVAWPVITSTATTVAAFLPMMFWPGLMGEFMKYLPITVIITLSSSLFVAMVISPTACSLLAGKAPPPPRRREHGFVRGYRALLGAALRHWPTTLALAVLLLIALGVTYAKRGHGVLLFPEFDPRRAMINIRCPQGTNIRKTDALARQVEHRLAHPRFRRDIRHVITNVGSAGEGAVVFGGASAGPHVANVTVLFHDYEERPRPSADAVKEIRAALTDIPGAEIKVEKEKEGPPTGEAVTVRIIGEEFRRLEQMSERAKALIADVPGLVNLRSDLEVTRPELVFQVDRRKAVMLGVNSLIIGNFLKTAVFGRAVGTFRQFNDEYDITIRLPLSERIDIEDLQRLQVPGLKGTPVPLSSLGEFDYRPGFGTIHRIGQKRVVTLTGDAEGRLGPDVLADVQARLDPKGYASFLTSDVADWDALRRCLHQPPPGPSPAGRLAERLGEELGGPFRPGLRPTLDDAVGTGTDARRARSRIAAAMRSVLGDRELYRPEAFAGVTLPEEALEYLRRGRDELSDKEVRRMNRVVLEAALPELIRARQRLELPVGYEVRYAGEKEEQEKAAQFLFRRALPLALLGIVLILVAQFNTLSAPLIIMFTVILSTIGVFVGLLACKLPFGVIMTGVGVISLAGVVVNNAIVLLSYTRQLQREGMEVMAAAVTAGVTRLRPVLLTAVTTILGLVPMATGTSLDFHHIDLFHLGEMVKLKSETSQFWASLAIAVIFGLTFATVLTLVVVPTLYTTLYRAAARFGLGGLRRRQAEGAVEAPAPAGGDRKGLAGTATSAGTK